MELLRTENMKTTLKQLATATFMALILVAGNVKANEIERLASSLEIKENTLQLENWMINEINWENSTNYMIDFETETESALELESWMTEEINWNSSMEFVTETEAKLELENWMTNENIWNAEESTDKILALENWMTDSKVWK